MKNYIFLFSIAFVFANPGKAQDEVSATTDQDTVWRTSGIVSFNFTQVYLENWVAGGQNSFSGVALFNYNFNYKKGRTSWDNSIDLAFGGIQQGKAGPIKADDRIQFSSKFGHKFAKSWFYSGLLSFRTQFAPGFRDPVVDVDPISMFMSPAFINLAFGADYQPSDNFSVFMGPLSGRVTVVYDQRLANEGAFGVSPALFRLTADSSIVTEREGERVRYEFGWFFKVAFKTKLMENVDFQTKLDMFGNYLDKPREPVVFWETLTSFKVNKLLSASLITNMIYDPNILFDQTSDAAGNKIGGDKRVQFKEVFGLGLSYKF